MDLSFLPDQPEKKIDLSFLPDQPEKVKGKPTGFGMPQSQYSMAIPSTGIPISFGEYPVWESPRTGLTERYVPKTFPIPGVTPVIEAIKGTTTPLEAAMGAGYEVAEAYLGGILLEAGLVKTLGMIKGSTWFRMLTNKERGLVAQSIEDMKKAGLSDAEIARKVPAYWEKLAEERMQYEKPLVPTEKPVKPAAEPTPILATVAPKPEGIALTALPDQPILSPTAKDQFALPGIKQGLEMRGAKEVTPTLEGTPLGEATRKAEMERVQPRLPLGEEVEGTIRELRGIIQGGQPGGVLVEGEGRYGSSQAVEAVVGMKGVGRKEALTAIDKGLNGEKLGVKQREIFDSVTEQARGVISDRKEADYWATRKTIIDSDPAFLKEETINSLTASIDDEIMGIKEELRNEGISDDKINKVVRQVEETYKTEGRPPDLERIKKELVPEPTKAPTKLDLSALPDQPKTPTPSGLQSAIIPGAKEFVEQDVIPKAIQLGGGLKDTFKRMIRVAIPRSGVSRNILDKVMDLKGERDKAQFLLETTTRKTEQFFDKLPRQEQIDFVDRIKTGQPQPTNQLQQIADMLKEFDDSLYDEIIKYKPSLPWKENHFRVMWKVIPGGTEAGFRGLFRRPLEGQRGFLKKATLEDISEGIAKGGVPISYNPITNFKFHYADAMKFVTANKMWEGLEDIGGRKFVRFGEKPPEGFDRLDDRIAKVYFHVPQGIVNAGEWWVERGAGRLLNNFLSRDLIREVSAGRGLMWLKNSTTAIELGFFNPFHAIFETFETVSSGVALGARKIYNIGILQGNLKAIGEGLGDILKVPISPITTARLGGKFIKFASNKDEFLKTVGGRKFLQKFPQAEEYVDDLFKSGGKLEMYQDYRINSIKTFREAINQNNYIGAALRSIPALNELQYKPLFEIYIPRLKLGLWLKEYPTALAERNADILSGKTTKSEIGREIWDSVENRFGEMNFDNLFWDNTFKTSLQMTFRSTTWKLGNVRMFGRSITQQSIEFKNAFKEKRMPRLSPEMAWVWGLAATTAAMGATTQRIFSGQWPWETDTPSLDFFYPRIDKEGHRISPQTYIKDIVSMVKAPLKYIEHSLSGWIGRFLEVITNKDFYNVQIHDPEDSFLNQRIDDLIHMVPLPFSFQSVKRTKEQKLSIERQILSYFAPRAPGYIEHTKAEQLVSELIKGHLPSKARTKEEFERSKRAQGYADEMNMAMKEKRSTEGLTSRMAEDVMAGRLMPKDLQRVAQDLKEPLESKVKRWLSLSESIDIWNEASTVEKIKLKPVILEKMRSPSGKQNIILDEKLKKKVLKFFEETNKR